MTKKKNRRNYERALAFDHFNILTGVYRLAMYDKKMGERNVDEGRGLYSSVKEVHNFSNVLMEDYLSACYFLHVLPRKDICSKKDFYRWILKEITEESF